MGNIWPIKSKEIRKHQQSQPLLTQQETPEKINETFQNFHMNMNSSTNKPNEEDVTKAISIYLILHRTN